MFMLWSSKVVQIHSAPYFRCSCLIQRHRTEFYKIVSPYNFNIRLSRASTATLFLCLHWIYVKYIIHSFDVTCLLQYFLLKIWWCYYTFSVWFVVLIINTPPFLVATTLWQALMIIYLLKHAIRLDATIILSHVGVSNDL